MKRFREVITALLLVGFVIGLFAVELSKKARSCDESKGRMCTINEISMGGYVND